MKSFSKAFLFLLVLFFASSCVTPMKDTAVINLPPIELHYGALPDNEICWIGKYGVRQCVDVSSSQGWVFCGKDKIMIYIRGYRDASGNIYFDSMRNIVWHELKHCVEEHGNPDTHWVSQNIGRVDWGDE